MRVLVLVKASKDSEAGVMPSQQLLSDRGVCNLLHRDKGRPALHFSLQVEPNVPNQLLQFFVRLYDLQTNFFGFLPPDRIAVVEKLFVQGFGNYSGLLSFGVFPHVHAQQFFSH